MLSDNETMTAYGYLASSLSQFSSKKIKINCDYCGAVYDTTKKIYSKARNIIEKDACKKCKVKKSEDICLKQYGVKKHHERQDVKDKIVNSNMQKYGVPYYVQTESFKKKSKETNITLYGCVNPMNNDSVKNKQKQAILDKYGVENISQNKEIKEKIKKTNLEKYGSEEYLASKSAREKIAKTNLEKYGVENVFQNEKIKDKIKETTYKKTGYFHHFKDKTKAQENAIKVLQSKIDNGNIKIFDGKTISQLRKNSGYSNSRFRALINQIGFEQAVLLSPEKSYLEQKMSKWLDSENIKYQSNKKLIKYFPDFILTDYNIVIELDGLYWHSDKVCDDARYHEKKRAFYLQQNLRPFFFREDEINNKFNIICSIIKNACKLNSNQIMARKCSVSKIDYNTSSLFCEKYHLMGKGSGSSYGLFYNNELISVITIKGNEISRYCTTENTTIIGGFTKLLAFAKKDLNLSSVETFIDLRYGLGNYLIDLGFTQEKTHLSFKWTDYKSTFHRMKYPSNSGYEHGLAKIWDCGQAKYSKIYN